MHLPIDPPPRNELHIGAGDRCIDGSARVMYDTETSEGADLGHGAFARIGLRQATGKSTMLLTQTSGLRRLALNAPCAAFHRLTRCYPCPGSRSIHFKASSCRTRTALGTIPCLTRRYSDSGARGDWFNSAVESLSPQSDDLGSIDRNDGENDKEDGRQEASDVENDSETSASEEAPGQRLTLKDIPQGMREMLIYKGMKLPTQVIIGRKGVDQGLVNCVKLHFRSHEVVRCKVAKQWRDIASDMAQDLEEKSGGIIVQRAGSCFILFRGYTHQDIPRSTPNREKGWWEVYR